MPRQVRPVEIGGDIVRAPLTRGAVAVVDVADVELVRRHNWCLKVTAGGGRYAMRRAFIDGKWQDILMHRVIANAPDGIEVDHESGDGLNNRRRNLRLATHLQNLANRKTSTRNASGHKGVYHQGKSYHASVCANGKRHYLGSFPTAEEASAAYALKATELFGEFACLDR